MSRRVLLIGWDAADWKVIEPLMNRGAMPALRRLVEGGSAGNIATLEPCLSPILWTSVATGKAPWRHGVRGFVEPSPDRSGLRPVGSASRRCKALWNIASQAGKRVHCAGWFASHPAECIHGVCVSDQFAVAPAASSPDNWPPAAGSVQPEAMATGLAEFRWHPAENTAADLQPFIHDAAQLDQTDPVQQRRLNFLSRTLAQCTGVHAAATWLMENEPWDLLMVYYEAIDQAGHEFMPFHPPRLPEINARDFHHWHSAVEGMYRFHDLMLARLLELAGRETVVVLVSDHGFVSGAQRPGPVANDPRTQAQWHRPFGVVVLHGPGIVSGERIYGASLLDIAPTVLHLLGLPCGEDMDGKVLAAAFRETVSLKTIASWETEGPPLASFLPPAVADEAAEAALLQQFAALGYVETVAGTPDVCAAERELRFNEARANAAAGRHREAAKILRGLTEEAPDEPRYRMALAQELMPLGDTGAARAALNSLPPDWRVTAEAELLHCQLLIQEDRAEEALQSLETAAGQHARNILFHCQRGMILLRRRRWCEAEQVFRHALTIDGESAFAWHGLAAALVEQDRTEESIEAALNAVGLQHFFPEAHFVLGRALVRQGDAASAIRALETALTQNPAHAASHSVLVRLHYRVGNPAAAHFHREALRHLRNRPTR
jgi:predicted AlkP superfamily phosphohydrolase/phosphomutase/tetratricopeptide (TPR) repeat protein